MTDPKCVICSTRDERTPQVIFENEHWRAMLSANQGYLGTLFIELRDHKESLPALSDEEWLSFARLSRIVEFAEREAFGAVMFNWTCLLNNFYKTYPPKPHVHWHVRPRYDHEVTVAGHLFIDPNFGHHYDTGHLAHVSSDLKETVSQMLRNLARGGFEESELDESHESGGNAKSAGHLSIGDKL
jgi:diadenosine tetraphosphate (Ap4A) HIT family hydrolase